MKKTLQIIRDRLHLVIPSICIEDETIASSYDGSKARLTIQLNPSLAKNAKVDIPDFVHSVSNNTCSNKSIQIDHYSEDDFLTITLTSLARTADNLIKPLTVPLYIEYGDTTYGIESPDSGATFYVTRNEEVVEEDCPSVAAALGKLQKHLLVDLSYSEELEEGVSEEVENQIDVDFMKSVAEWMANSPTVPEEAKKHLILFVEFLTNRDFEPEEEDEVE